MKKKPLKAAEEMTDDKLLEQVFPKRVAKRIKEETRDDADNDSPYQDDRTRK